MARDMCVATAAVRLMLHYPFWCELYYTMKVIESVRIPTLCTDGKRMWVNPKFWDTLTLDYKVAALAHEVCHKMLHHCTRGRGLLKPWDNIAMDIVVNTLLHQNGFKIHKDWVQPRMDMVGWTFEAVYQEITKHLQEPPEQPQGGEGTDPPPEQDDDQQEQPGGGSGEGEDDGDEEGKGGAGSPGEESEDGEGEGEGDPEGSGYCDGDGVPDKYKGAWSDVKPFKGTPEQIEAFEEKIEEQVQQAIAAAKAMGHAPAGVEMAVTQNIVIPEEKWFDHLHRYFQSLRMAEYDWAKINRRYAMKYRVIAPTQYTERLGPVVIFTDASGSCFDAATQANFGGHTGAILSEAQPSECHVAYFEMGVTKSVQVDPGALEFEPQPNGGGGTSFTQLIPWMEEEGIYPDVVIILTDGYGAFPAEAPPYPVIWAMTTDVVAPFGETIHIK